MYFVPSINGNKTKQNKKQIKVIFNLGQFETRDVSDPCKTLRISHHLKYDPKINKKFKTQNTKRLSLDNC